MVLASSSQPSSSAYPLDAMGLPYVPSSSSTTTYRTPTTTTTSTAPTSSAQPFTLTAAQLTSISQGQATPSAYGSTTMHGFTMGSRPGEVWDAVKNAWVPNGSLSPTPSGWTLYGQSASTPVTQQQPNYTYPAYDPRSPYYNAHLAATTTTPISNAYSTYQTVNQSQTPTPGMTAGAMTPLQLAKQQSDIAANQAATAAAYNAGVTGPAGSTLAIAPTPPTPTFSAPAPLVTDPLKLAAAPSTASAFASSGMTQEQFAQQNKMVPIYNDPATLQNTVVTMVVPANNPYAVAIPSNSPQAQQMQAAGIQMVPVQPTFTAPTLNTPTAPPTGGMSAWSQQLNPNPAPVEYTPWGHGGPIAPAGSTSAEANTLAATMSGDRYTVQQMGLNPITLTRAQQQMLATIPVSQFGTPQQVHGLTVDMLPGQAWDAVLNKWVPIAQLSFMPGTGMTPPQGALPQVNDQTRAPSPTDTASMIQSQPGISPGQQTGQPPHAAPTTPETGAYTPSPPPTMTAPGGPAGTVSPVTSPPVTTPPVTVPPPPTVTAPGGDARAQAEQSIISLFGKVLMPSQVPLRIWNKLLPSQKEMLRGAWEAMGIFIPDVDHMIEAAGNTNGISFTGGWGAVGR